MALSSDDEDALIDVEVEDEGRALHPRDTTEEEEEDVKPGTDFTLLRHPKSDEGEGSSKENEGGEVVATPRLSWVRHSPPSDDDEEGDDALGSIVFQCLFGTCFYTTPCYDDLRKHLQEHVESAWAAKGANAFFPCMVPTCERAFSHNALSEMQSHISLHACHAECQRRGLDILLRRADQQVQLALAISPGSDCGFPYNLKIHHNGEPFFCEWEDCGECFIDMVDFFSHCNSHVDFCDKYAHGPHNVVQCEWYGCEKLFRYRAHLRSHIPSHTGEKASACPFCGTWFSCNTKMIDHVVRKSSAASAASKTCQLCRKSFSDERRLRIHVARHMSIIKCSVCSVLFTAFSDLQRHMNIKHSDNPSTFSCNECNYVCRSHVELEMHSKVHEAPGLKCEQCPEVFRYAKQLKKHVNIVHLGIDRPYLCHVCEESEESSGARFNDGSTLSRHLQKTHHLSVPEGFPRFQFKKCSDGYFRLNTFKYRSMELEHEMNQEKRKKEMQRKRKAEEVAIRKRADKKLAVESEELSIWDGLGMEEDNWKEDEGDGDRGTPRSTPRRTKMRILEGTENISEHL